MERKKVKNISDLEQLDLLCTKIKIEWVWYYYNEIKIFYYYIKIILKLKKYVQGHKGIEGNIQADILAKKAVFV